MTGFFLAAIRPVAPNGGETPRDGADLLAASGGDLAEDAAGGDGRPVFDLNDGIAPIATDPDRQVVTDLPTLTPDMATTRGIDLGLATPLATTSPQSALSTPQPTNQAGPVQSGADQPGTIPALPVRPAGQLPVATSSDSGLTVAPSPTPARSADSVATLLASARVAPYAGPSLPQRPASGGSPDLVSTPTADPVATPTKINTVPTAQPATPPATPLVNPAIARSSTAFEDTRAVFASANAAAVAPAIKPSAKPPITPLMSDEAVGKTSDQTAAHAPAKTSAQPSAEPSLQFLRHSLVTAKPGTSPQNTAPDGPTLAKTGVSSPDMARDVIIRAAQTVQAKSADDGSATPQAPRAPVVAPETSRAAGTQPMAASSLSAPQTTPSEAEVSAPRADDRLYVPKPPSPATAPAAVPVATQALMAAVHSSRMSADASSSESGDDVQAESEPLLDRVRPEGPRAPDSVTETRPRLAFLPQQAQSMAINDPASNIGPADPADGLPVDHDIGPAPVVSPHATGPASATAAASSNPALAAPIVQQIRNQLVQSDDGIVEIRLDPPELGRVLMSIQTVEGGLSAQVLVERPETLELLRRHAELLDQALADAGHGDAEINFGTYSDQTGKEFVEDDDPHANLDIELSNMDASSVWNAYVAGDSLDIRL